MPPLQKGKSTSVGAKEIPSSGESVFDAVLYPNRSLPNQGFALVMAIVIVVNLALGSYFYAKGAWPVLGFCGLDILAVWLAFKVSYRQGRLRERVRLDENEMWVSRVLPSGHESRWKLQPFWTRVEFDRPVDHESHVRVISKGHTLVLGSFLSPDERDRFADALQSALRTARRAAG